MIGDRAAREVSLGSLTFVDRSTPQIVDIAAAAGYRSVGLRVTGGARRGDPEFSLVHDERLRVETSRRLLASGLTVLDAEGLRITDEFDPARDADDMRRLIDVAHELGATRLLVFSDVDDDARNTDAFGLVCELSRGSGIVPGLEFAAWAGVDSLERACAVVRAADGGGGIVVDSLHLSRTEGTPEAVVALATPVAYLQLSDAPGLPPASVADKRRESRLRLLPGDGELPLAQLVAAVDPSVPISVEVPNNSRGDDVDWARRARERVLELLAHGDQLRQSPEGQDV